MNILLESVDSINGNNKTYELNLKSHVGTVLFVLHSANTCYRLSLCVLRIHPTCKENM
jgi:hypothetical protein